MLGLFIAALLTGCSATQAEHENLVRRVRALENRVAVLEGRGPGAAGGSAKGPTARATVEVAGDAEAVYLRVDRHRYRVPGNIPVGTYSIRAVFGPGRPTVAGDVTLGAEEQVRIVCDAAVRRCQAERL